MPRIILADLPTPSLLLERSRLLGNLQRMSARMQAMGVALRPHLKTAKCLEVADLAGARAITVSTMAEAEFFAGGGYTDILYAVGIVPAKLARAAALLNRGVTLTLLLDHPQTVDAVTEAGTRLGVAFPVLIEVDCGQGRAGTPADSTLLLETAVALTRGGGATLKGVLTHAGHSYKAQGPEDIAAVAEAERSTAVRSAERLRAAGCPCPVVSVGSTPTALFGRSFDGVTEVRAGVYMFGDLFQAGLGTCTLDDIAVSVLASVIGHRRDRGHLLLDAGSLALSADRSTAGTPFDAGYGRLATADGDPFDPPLTVAWVNQEHGVVPVSDPMVFNRLPVGDRVRVLPNHACIAAAMYDRYTVIEDGTVIGTWRRINGW